MMARSPIRISLSNNSNEQVSISFTNLLGQVLKTENLGNEISIHANLNVSDLPKGIYFMNLKIGQNTSIKKIVKE